MGLWGHTDSVASGLLRLVCYGQIHRAGSKAVSACHDAVLQLQEEMLTNILFHRYPSNPVVTRKPSKAPTRGDGKAFSVSDNLDAEANTDDQSHTDDTNKDHQVPACEDHPVQGTATFGASTVNNDAKTYCNTNSLSGIHYNEFYSQGENIDNPNTYDNFCKGIDGTINGYWYADSHGKKVPDIVPASQIHGRTPSVNAMDMSKSAFTVELIWTKDDVGDGCGQTTESCRNAFAKLAESPCGHQGGGHDTFTTEGNITLPDCGTYGYKFMVGGGDGGGNQDASDAQPAKPAPDMNSPA